MKLISEQSFFRPEVLRWHRRIKERYSPPCYAGLFIIFPCSAKKPYSESESHRIFARAIKKAAEKKINSIAEIILTSPFGIVPRELERLYPVAHYDTVVTGYWSYEEKKIANELLEDYIKKCRKIGIEKESFIAYVDGAYREICERLEIEIIPEKESNLKAESSLIKLEKKVREKLKNRKSKSVDIAKERLKKIADFQFGKGAGELLTANAKVKKGMIFDKKTNKLIARENKDYGYLELTLEGAERVLPLKKYFAKLSFNPEEIKGRTRNIFCSGIEDACKEIRPGDEVIVLYKNALIGIGKSLLSGEELVRAKKGLGIVVREFV